MSWRDQIAAYFDDVRTWLPKILRHRARYEGNWVLNRRQRWFYTAKAVLSLLLNLDENRGHPLCEEGVLGHVDHVEVAAGGYFRYCHHEFGEAAEWEYFAVGHGWRHWGFRVGSAGYP